MHHWWRHHIDNFNFRSEMVRLRYPNYSAILRQCRPDQRCRKCEMAVVEAELQTSARVPQMFDLSDIFARRWEEMSFLHGRSLPWLQLHVFRDCDSIDGSRDDFGVGQHRFSQAELRWSSYVLPRSWTNPPVWVSGPQAATAVQRLFGAKSRTSRLSPVVDNTWAENERIQTDVESLHCKDVSGACYDFEWVRVEGNVCGSSLWSEK